MVYDENVLVGIQGMQGRRRNLRELLANFDKGAGGYHLSMKRCMEKFGHALAAALDLQG